MQNFESLNADIAMENSRSLSTESFDLLMESRPLTNGNDNSTDMAGLEEIDIINASLDTDKLYCGAGGDGPKCGTTRTQDIEAETDSEPAQDIGREANTARRRSSDETIDRDSEGEDRPEEPEDDPQEKPEKKPEDIGKQGNKLRDALSWAQKNMSRFDHNGDGLTKEEMGLAALDGSANEQDRKMMRVLYENFDQVRDTHFTDLEIEDGKPIDDHNAITGDDVNWSLKRIESQEIIENNKIETREMSEQLLQGEPPLFDVLDRASNGKIDGKISRGDLERYLNEYKFMSQYGDNIGPFNKENAELVQRMFDTWDQPLSPGNLMRGITNEDQYLDSHFKHQDRYKYITRNSIVRGNGLG